MKDRRCLAPKSWRYLALFLPLLPTDRLARRLAPDTEGPAAPLVLVEKVKGALRLAACDAPAQCLGIMPGMTLADARALEPGLAVADHDPGADSRWLERLCDGALRYTPMAAVDGVDGLMLDITGAEHLFGGEQMLADDAARRLQRGGIAVRWALASTPEAAHALARYQTRPARDEMGAIRRLPVAALELDEEATLGLKRAGLKTIADLADRPSAGLAARFGLEAVRALDRLLGDAARPIAPRRPVPAIVAERRFAEPLTSTPHALAVLAELMTDVAASLATRDRGGRAFEAAFFRADGMVYTLKVETGRPGRDPEAAMRLFRERLDSLADPLDPGFGFDLIRLAVLREEALAPEQLVMEGREAEMAVGALVDGLSVRVGRGRILRLRPRDSHVPERAELALPAVACRTPAPWPRRAPGEPPLRPLHLFDPPQPIEVLAEVPDGAPQRFRWRRTLHQVSRYEGPERIAPEWWQDDADPEASRTRDYFRLEDVRGRRFWIFRNGLYGTRAGEMDAPPRWYLHGLFA